MYNPQNFSPDSVLGNVRVDVHASKRDGKVTITHGGVFEDPLIALEYDVKTQELFFLFEGDMEMPLGAPMQPQLIPYLLKSDKVAVARLDDAGEVVGGNIVPLKIIEA